MSSRGHNHTRSRSRTDAFLDALEGGHLREAVGTLNPTRPSDGHRHRHQHHSSRGHDYNDEAVVRHSRYDNYYPQEDRYYYESTQRPRRHRSVQSDRYYEDRRGRSGHHGHGHSHSHSHGHGHRRASSSHAGPDLKQAAGAAVAAGVVEAWRSRHDANRTMRVATAAIGAAATDSALGGGPHHKEKRHVVESALAGLVENRVINGPRR
ncbi:hypothetical protein GGR51DRAFT_533217 [Nemania sp. FL0031]|nr:hypothetical protein GGR51DRAFT_533217 [Nemania sp. FL0031]